MQAGDAIAYIDPNRYLCNAIVSQVNADASVNLVYLHPFDQDGFGNTRIELPFVQPFSAERLAGGYVEDLAEAQQIVRKLSKEEERWSRLADKGSLAGCSVVERW